MRLRSKVVSAVCGSTLVAAVVVVSYGSAAPANAAQPAAAPPAEVDAVARDLHISQDQARSQLVAQAKASAVAKELPPSLTGRLAGKWFDAATGKLMVAVTDRAAADQARAAGAEPKLVASPSWTDWPARCASLSAPVCPG